MRARIDVSEIEAKTKIRAKYLRALENEEWGLLPGPTFVKSFLRTYAQALGLDGKALVEEYRAEPRAPERGGARADRLQPAAQPSADRVAGARPAGPRAATWRSSACVVLADRAADRRPAQQRRRLELQTRRARSLQPGGHRHNASAHAPHAGGTPASSRERRAWRSRCRPTAPVYVCLIGDDGRKLIPGNELQAGESTPTYHARRFEITLGNSAVTMFVDGTRADGRRLQPGDRLLDHQGAGRQRAARRRSCRRARERCARGSSSRAPRCSPAASATATARGWPSGCASSASTSRTPRSSATAREDMHAALAFMAEQELDLVLTSGGLGPDRRRPHGRGRGRLPGARDGARRGARGAHRRDPARRWRSAGRTSTWRRSGRATASRRRSQPAPRCSSRSAPRPGSSCRRASRGAGPDDRRPAGAAARAAADVGAAPSQTEALRAALRGATTYRQRMLRLFGIPESEIAETLRVAEREGVRARSPRDHDLPETRRGRGRDALRARRRGRLRGVRARSSPSATPTRCSPTRRRHRSTSRSPRCCATRAHRSRTASRAPAGCWRRA